MDKLIAYLNSLPRGGRSEFARRADLCPTYLWRIEHGQKGVGLTVALRLVKASGGALKLDDFAPDTDAQRTAEQAAA